MLDRPTHFSALRLFCSSHSYMGIAALLHKCYGEQGKSHHIHARLGYLGEHLCYALMY